MKVIIQVICLIFFLINVQPTNAQRKKNKATVKVEKSALEKLPLSGLKFRSIGPALTSGRISDFAMHPDNPFYYYVATSSGGVWKTVNNGTTFDPIFDGQGSYSIGCVTLDPNNPSTVWVGTGENNNQRSVAYGDGVYKSINGGKSWKHMGLKESEHIGNIIVHPNNSNVIYAAAIGPLWSSGGDRGLYKSVDGGHTWKATLTIDKHTGVNEVHMDPRNPDIMYAVAFQRARHTYTYLGGGPGSTIYKSVDGGETWNKSAKGLPGTDIGRIGMSISPANPDYIYAIVEAAEGKSGFYISTNAGNSWSKRSSFVTSGNYYQEIVTDPIDAERIYAMDTWLKVSKDGGRSFKNTGEDTKHVDNHCMWINPQNNDHWIVGCDGGIYETWDAAKTWDFKANLPVTQFYKVAVDNDLPFYNIYGGTQDNFSLGGPSRTNTDHGIQNSDWFITNGGDGFESQIDPENPDIVYAQSQYGNLVRYDKRSGEGLGIQPTPGKGEDEYIWNWDAPLQVSPHKSGRLYFCANKVFRSDDYGNSWTTLSEDLSQNLDRNQLKIMDRLWSVDAMNKNRSTSPYGSIVAFSESAKNENLLITGSDDGLIHISEDGGGNWRKVTNLPGTPVRSYVNAVYASQHDENVMYAALNHHKFGDFKPYLFKSNNKGVSWTAIQNNLPKRGSVYAFEEDHVDPNLIFCGTEFGVFFSNDGGKKWIQLKAGVPTVAVRDIAIQRRENDLVLGTFGRGFYVLDDYSVLRNIKSETLDQEAVLFNTRPALQYEKSMPLGLPGKSFQGDSYYIGENLDPVAIFTYYLKEGSKDLKKERLKQEGKERKANKDNPYPTYETLKAEREQKPEQLVFTIKDDNGKIVRKLFKKPSKGVNRITWDLRYAPKDAISFSKPSFYNPFAGKSEGSLVEPGTYTIIMDKIKDGKFVALNLSENFEVKPLNNTVLPADDRTAKVEFQREIEEFSRSVQGARRLVGEVNNKMRHIKEAIKIMEEPMDEVLTSVDKIDNDLKQLSLMMNGDPIKRKLDLDQPPTPSQRLGKIRWEQKNSTANPTKTHMESFAIAKEEFKPIFELLNQIAGNAIPALESQLEKYKAPYTPGRALKMMQGQ